MGYFVVGDLLGGFRKGRPKISSDLSYDLPFSRYRTFKARPLSPSVDCKELTRLVRSNRPAFSQCQPPANVLPSPGRQTVADVISKL